ncbi:MAG: hypothetical protein H7240_10710 [Glaciimonas sp.]|nr:hypothetical protein [Glaciimonas sp.]
MNTNTIAPIFFRYPFQIMTIGLGVTLATFLCLTYFAEPQWEAVGVIRVGQLPVLVAAGIKSEALPVVPVAAVMEMMRQPSFLPQSQKTAATSFFPPQQSMRVRLLPSGHVEVKVRAMSDELAASQVEASLKQLKAMHDTPFNQRVSIVKTEIQRIDRQLAINESIQGRNTALIERDLKSPPSLPELLYSNILAQQAERSDRLMDYRVRLYDSLDPQRTFPTDIFGKIEVSDLPVFPNKLIFASLSFLTGLFISAFFILVLYFKERVSASSAAN